MALTTTDYSALTKKCILWAEAADTQDTSEAFLALAEAWKRISAFDQSVPKCFPRPVDLMLQMSVAHGESNSRRMGS